MRPEGAGREFWRRIDLADHVDEIEAPILMHLAAHEAYSQIPLNGIVRGELKRDAARQVCCRLLLRRRDARAERRPEKSVDHS